MVDWLMSHGAASVLVLTLGFIVFIFVLTRFFRYIPNNRIGVVEKLWSARGSVR